MPNDLEARLTKLDPRLATMLAVADDDVGRLQELVKLDTARAEASRAGASRAGASRAGASRAEASRAGAAPDGELGAFAQRARQKMEAYIASRKRADAPAGSSAQRAAITTNLGRAQRLLAPFTTGVRMVGDEPRLRVFVHGTVTLEDILGDAAATRVSVRAGTVTLCELSAKQIGKLLQHEGVEGIELVRPVHAALGQVKQDYQELDAGVVPAGRALPGGKGVIVGIVDFGLDFHHSELRHLDGSTRVLGLWDQSAGPGDRGSQPDDYGYGWAWTQQDIDDELTSDDPPYTIVPHRWDRQGGRDAHSLGPDGTLWMRHGTHMAVVAAGNGRSGRPGPKGIAHEADLLFVSLDPEVGLADADDVWGMTGIDRVIEGVKWILERAKEIGPDIPVVINLSLADYTGPHDGQSPHQAFLDAIQDEPGRVLVVAAGNANGGGGHAMARVHPVVGPAADGTFHLVVKEGADADDAMEFWVDGTGPLSLEIQVPGAPEPWVADLSEGVASQSFEVYGQQVQLLAARVVKRAADVTGVRVDMLLAPGSQQPPGTWVIKLAGGRAGTRDAHAWLEWSNAGLRYWLESRDDEVTISDLASHPAMLAVGSTHKLLGQQNFEVASHSGRGPTRDGRSKPDIAAQGANVRMAEAHCRVGIGKGLGREYVAASGSGTSISTAIVSGACAVVMDARGGDQARGGKPAMLSTAELREIFQSTASRRVVKKSGEAKVEFADGKHPAVGAGVMDLRAACWGLPPTDQADLWLKSFGQDQGEIPRATSVFWTSPDIIVERHGLPTGGSLPGARVRVRVRNRGQMDAGSVHVSLGWGPLVTWIPAEREWLESGKQGRDDAPGSSWLGQGVQAVGVSGTGNARAVVGDVPSDAEGYVEAAFDWIGPKLGPTADQVSWIAMISGLEDPAAGPHGRDTTLSSPTLLRKRNEVAVRSLVSVTRDQRGEATLRFYVRGTEGRDGLTIATEGDISLRRVRLPLVGLPVRAGVRTPATRGEVDIARLGSLADAIAAIGQRYSTTDIFDVRGFAGASLDPGDKSERLDLLIDEGLPVIPELRLADGELMLVEVAMTSVSGGTVHVIHSSSGRVIGGVSGQVAGLAPVDSI